MEFTRWLTREEQRTWRTFMLAVKLLWEQLERELDQGSEVRSPYYEILVRLSEAPDRRVRLSDLADRLQNSRSRLSHSVARLESLGWIVREACPSDRRGAFAVLTDRGGAALRAAAPVHVESVRTHLFDQLDATQLEQLRAISQQLLSHLVEVRGASLDVQALLGAVSGCS